MPARPGWGPAVEGGPQARAKGCVSCPVSSSVCLGKMQTSWELVSARRCSDDENCVCVGRVPLDLPDGVGNETQSGAELLSLW